MLASDDTQKAKEPTINDEQVIKDTTNNGNSKRKRGRGKTRAQRHKEKQPKPDYQPIVKNNDAMIKFYKHQSFLLPGEFEEFLNGLKETLPASFRINTFDVGQANFLLRLIEGPELAQFLTPQFNDHDKTTVNDGEKQELQSEQVQAKPPTLEPLCWYPKRLAWQMNTTRLDLKRTPILQQFHKFLMAETDNGFISRQEAVSMIPPLILDVHRGHSVLDMCAAPGSKTAQLLEYLKNDIFDTSSIDNNTADPREPFDDGIVVANDVDNKRCYMLVHQSNRLNSPNCIIVNGDASRLPNMQTFNNEGEEFINLRFDRILCDVPCSGDGTIRKNPDVWKKWTVGNANNFHGIQCKVLRRGVELLKENGLLVYSTCSMNPVEDEAVIASILRASNGKVVLHDIAHKLPGLKYRPGISKWVVMNRDTEIVESIDKVPPEHTSQIHPSLFPPTDEEAKSFNLNKALRILPHLQNTGGFFVAVLKKLSADLPWETPTSKVGITSSDQSKDNVDGNTAKPMQQPNPKKRRLTGFKEDPFIFMDENDPDWVAIKNCYGLSEQFPAKQLIHRCTSGKKRSIYLVSKKTRSFIMANREEPGRSDFVKIINGGMRLFSRADTSAGFRICQDGVNEVLPYIKDDIKVSINRDDLVALLKSRAVSWDLLSNGEHIRDNIKQGSFILIYKHKESETSEGESFEMPLVAWKGEWTVALYVANTYRIHLCALAQLKIGDDGVIKPEATTNAKTLVAETGTTAEKTTEVTEQ